MIRDPWRLHRWEARRQRLERLGLCERLALLDAMVAEAHRLGAWPPADLLEGIEQDIRRAAILRRLPRRAASPKPRRSTP